MRGFTPGKCVIWALLLSWPWVVRYVAQKSPEMIEKGYSESSSIWMPLIADIVLLAGGGFVLLVRRNQQQAIPQAKFQSGALRPHLARYDRRPASSKSSV